MNKVNTIFFGSTNDSILILEKLYKNQLSNVTLSICCIVTQPPRPVGRKQLLTPTPVEEWAKKHTVPVLSFPHPTDKPWLFENEETVIDALQPFKADLIISTCFGQKIPANVITGAHHGGLNVHPSLLPRWRGADPVPWAILSGDHQTGITVVTLEERFDQGNIIAQKKYPITEKSTSDTLRTQLFSLGATLLTNVLPDFLSHAMSSRVPIQSGRGDLNNTEIASSTTPRNDKNLYARRFTREDGYIPWELLSKAMQGIDVPNDQRPSLLALDICHLSFVIERASRALSPWPGLWTELAFNNQKLQVGSQEKKRLKILSCHLGVNHTAMDAINHPLLVLDTVQLEGKLPISFAQFKHAYL